MSENWADSEFQTSTGYAAVISRARGRDKDSVTLDENPTNPPTNYVRYNRSLNKFQTWNGLTWIDLILSIAGGGAGGATASAARTALGLGSLAIQNANSVAITGGAISGLITLELSNGLTFNADNTLDIGTAIKAPRYVYISGGLKLPVGVDKWVPS